MIKKCLKNIFPFTSKNPGDYDTFGKKIPKVESSRLKNFSVGVSQSIGKVRSTNEDAIFTLQSTVINHKHSQIFGLFVIADGMGGHLYGEIASEIAVKTATNHVIESLLLPTNTDSNHISDKMVVNFLNECIQKANQSVLENAPGGGTTLTLALIYNKKLFFTHVGDSRIYFINNKKHIQQLTRDHSWVRHLFEQGQITAHEAQNHPQKNVLYQALGQNNSLKPEVKIQQIPSSGYYLLCSDGLWGSVDEQKILDLIVSTREIQNTCDALLMAANEAGGDDNISVILIEI